MKQLRRFGSLAKPRPEMVKMLAHNHPALKEARTLFPSTVKHADEAPNVLVSGLNNRKIGAVVTKGEWSGMAIHMLTLEERATCPTNCAQWRDCYGNAMHWARRHRHGPELETRITRQLKRLSMENPRGFVVRLHVLGDFYSPEYVDFWLAMMAAFPLLHLFGYTARRNCPIAARIAELNTTYPQRCYIRTSGENALVVTSDLPQPQSFICPAETHATECCATCGLCWATAARSKLVLFLKHGMTGARRAA